ncbi:hypothetical protein NEMBOFW57_003302 [Staphylotrichum longicolle]|uniref:Uncharacterized protein n=1 Tax=Staphylotrichum longicolle TaxID=669026 RepID=A0AAD4F563_9PEZI|nr:hypothetical protein NEMBOFW57_003302 [Staphylotrichum longicolle]
MYGHSFLDAINHKTYRKSQAAAYDRRQEAATSTINLADGFMSMINRLGGGQTVTETIRQTITVGGGGAVGAGLNATGAVTVTVTAAASTVTLCPGQAQGAVEGVQGGGSASAAPGGAAGANTLPVVVASGGIGVTVISVPEEARKTSLRRFRFRSGRDPHREPAGAFGGSAGAIPMASAAVPPPPPPPPAPSATTPVVANGAGAGPTIDVSGLTLSSQLNLGNLAQAKATATARA